jgi:hypothetical protein
MGNYVLIACVGDKRSAAAPACDLYQSPLFRKALRYAQRLNPDGIFILSAKYGLVPSNAVIAPYDETLNDKSTPEIRAWADRVLHQLRAVFNLESDHFTILAGQNYRKFLVPSLRHYDVPLEGLGIGKQLQALDRLAQ